MLNRIFKGIGNILLITYVCPLLVFGVYHNWNDLKTNGFFEWLWFGEVVACAKAVVWPYTVYNYMHKNVVVLPDEQAKSQDQPPGLNENEQNMFKQLLENIHSPLSNSDLASYKNILNSYKKRTGKGLTKSDYHLFMFVIELASDYQKALGESLLASWDKKQYVTTKNFQDLFNEMKGPGLRSSNSLNQDLAALQAASKRQNYIEFGGSQYAFGREQILEGIEKGKIIEDNVKQLAAIYDAMTDFGEN